MTSAGDLITLEEQDRSLWDHNEIDEGAALLVRAFNMQAPGLYQLQAAIAALHADAKSPEQTDWREIEALYRELARMNGSAVVRLNWAVATH